MTTIILVAIGVLIAAAAALFMIFYGGEAFNESAVKAEASRLVSEGAQIEYATDLYYRQEGRMPGRLSDGTLSGEQAMVDLRSGKYLNQVPKGSTLTNVDDWRLEYGDDGMIYSRLGASGDEKALTVCKTARQQLGFQVREGDDELKVYKCDGSDYFDARWHGSNTLPENEPCCIRG